jgi:hypothetical protein
VAASAGGIAGSVATEEEVCACAGVSASIAGIAARTSSDGKSMVTGLRRLPRGVPVGFVVSFAKAISVRIGHMNPIKPARVKRFRPS